MCTTCASVWTTPHVVLTARGVHRTIKRCLLGLCLEGIGTSNQKRRVMCQDSWQFDADNHFFFSFSSPIHLEPLKNSRATI
jgi:hypothetical protein